MNYVPCWYAGCDRESVECSIGTFGTYARARAHGSRVRRPSPIRVLTRQTADAQREPRVTLPVRRAGRHRPEGLAPIPRPTSAGRRCVQPGGTFGAHAPQRAVVVDRDDQWDRRIRTRPRPEADDRSRLGERSRPRPSLWLDSDGRHRPRLTTPPGPSTRSSRCQGCWRACAREGADCADPGPDLTGTGDLGQRILAEVPPEFQAVVAPLIPNIVAGIHEAFSIAVGATFWWGIAGTLVAAVVVLFLKEQPLRATYDMPEDMGAEGAAESSAHEGAPAGA
jgi:hypothetical protein